MKKGYVIAGSQYATKDEITKRCRSISSRRGLIDGDDLEFLLDLLPFHHEWEEKVRPGLMSMEFRVNPDYPTTRTLYLKRADGTEIDISWVQAIRDIPTGRNRIPNGLRDFRSAARNEIADQIDAYLKGVIHNRSALCDIR